MPVVDQDPPVPNLSAQGRVRLVDFPLVDDPRTLLRMVQMHCIDMNAWYSRIDEPDRPDFALFDLRRRAIGSSPSKWRN
jgi:DNA primase